MGDAASSCFRAALPPPPRERPPRSSEPRIHVAVPIATSSVELLVAAATLHAFEMHDAAMMAEDDGDEFDPRTDACEGIFGSYDLLRRDADPARPYWLCGTPHRGFSEQDIERALRRMGHFGRRAEVIYACDAPLQSTDHLAPRDIEAHADELGVRLPRDAHARVRALVDKHMPLPKYLENATAAMQRLERAAAEFRLTYDYGSPMKRARTQSPPPAYRRSLTV